jgi:hypothetical protein
MVVPLHARSRPQLTPAAVALLDKGGVFLVPDDNLAIPLQPKGKPVPLLAAAPQQLELVSGGAAPYLLIDGDLYQLKGAGLTLVAAHVGEMPSVSVDGKLVAGIEDKRGLKLTRAGAASVVPYHREGNWELDRPFVTPDGAWVLAVVHDYTGQLDAYDFVVVNAKTSEYVEIDLSKNFVPGPLRQMLEGGQVAIRMFAQEEDDRGFPRLVESDLVAFDFKTKKLGPAPADLRPGLQSPDGHYSLLTGPMRYSDNKSCGGDDTTLYEEGKPRAHYLGGEGTVVSVLDFLPDSSAVIANVLTLKGCKSRGVVIPLKGGERPSAWKPFPLPSHAGHLTGRIISR